MFYCFLPLGQLGQVGGLGQMCAAPHSCHAFCSADDRKSSVRCTPRRTPATHFASSTTKCRSRDVRRAPFLPSVLASSATKSPARDVRRVQVLPRILYRRRQTYRARCAPRLVPATHFALSTTKVPAREMRRVPLLPRTLRRRRQTARARRAPRPIHATAFAPSTTR